MKRSAPMKRQPLVRQPPKTARASVPVKRCKACRSMFTPASSWQTHCRAEACAIAAAEVAQAKRQRQEAREHRERLADSKPLAHWLDLTQRAVNALVKARDAGKPCISCGCLDAYEWDAGHYLSRGARPELRFDLSNIALQCAACNRHKGGNQAQFRLGLIARIGLAEVERLEGPHPPAKFTRESLALIRSQAAAETRRLKKEST